MKHSRLPNTLTIRTSKGPTKLNAVSPNNVVSEAPIFRITHEEWQSRVSTLLRDEVASARSPVKELANAAGSSVAAAKHWYGFEATPQGIHMSRLRAAYPSFHQKMCELEGMRASMDSSFLRKLSDFFLQQLAADPDSPFVKEVYQNFFKTAEPNL